MEKKKKKIESTETANMDFGEDDFLTKRSKQMQNSGISTKVKRMDKNEPILSKKPKNENEKENIGKKGDDKKGNEMNKDNKNEGDVFLNIKIVEHDIDDEEVLDEIKVNNNLSFPKVMDRFESKIDFSRKKPKDQETIIKPPIEKKIEEKKLNETISNNNPNNINVDEIKRENSSKINTMTIEEIKQAQKEILGLDPGLLEKLQFLAGKSKKEEKVEEENNNTNLVINENDKKIKIKKDVNNQSHFNKIQGYFIENDKKRNMRKQMLQKDRQWSISELDLKKMEWMSKDQEKPKSLLWNITEEELISLVRFGFDGEIIPLNEELPKGKMLEGLYHHGDDQENPGYTLEEIEFLIRSSFSSQSVINVNMISNIIQRSKDSLSPQRINSEPLDTVSNEYYDPLVALGVLEYIIFYKFHITLRVSLDSSNNTLILASLNAINNLISTEEDEKIFDNYLFYGGSEMMVRRFEEPKLMDEEDEEVKTEEGDVVRELVFETSLCERIRYIMELLEINGAEPIALDILISIARYSRECALYLYNCPHMIEYLNERFIKSTKPMTLGETEKISKVIKLFRILSSNERSVAERLIKDGITSTIKNKYILSGLQEESHGPFIEAMRLWMTCLTYELDHAGFVEILRQLLLVIEKTNFNDTKSLERSCLVFNVVHIITGFGSKYPNASWGWVHVVSLLVPSQKILAYIHNVKEEGTSSAFSKNFRCITNLISSIYLYYTSIFKSILESPNKDDPSTKQQVSSILEKQVFAVTKSPFFSFLVGRFDDKHFFVNRFSSLSLSSVAPFVCLLDARGYEAEFHFLSSLLSSVNQGLELCPLSASLLPTHFFNSKNFYDLSNKIPYNKNELEQLTKEVKVFKLFNITQTIKFNYQTLKFYQNTQQNQTKETKQEKAEEKVKISEIYSQSLFLISLLNSGFEFYAFDVLDHFVFNVDLLFSLSVNSEEKKTPTQNSFLYSIRNTLLTFYKNFFSTFSINSSENLLKKRGDKLKNLLLNEFVDNN
eukprot:TRINITY_DN4859_c0_g1_i1.p1 TRINITY_DN4859_c0_g1~~TRINITY_DN4859_c0_g1_i1.p1  ORF type:complete len:1007 (+),score=340.66 TRINITY_DN4859_c0_g1_i1:80-3100(+)